MRILLAEDERPLARALVKIFEKNFFTVDAVENGEDALAYLESGQYDVAVLDIMMPKADGITVLRRLRAAGNAIPVLLLTAKSEVDDKVQGLDSGANYYLTKPFDTKELLATLRAITRSRTSGDSRLTFGSVTLDRSTFTLSSPSGSFRLWGCDSDADITVVWVYVSYLRKKLAALHADIQIKAHRNAGYSLEEAP